jgi:hypothetical protein
MAKHCITVKRDVCSPAGQVLHFFKTSTKTSALKSDHSTRRFKLPYSQTITATPMLSSAAKTTVPDLKSLIHRLRTASPELKSTPQYWEN